MDSKIFALKTDVSREDSVNFHHMSQTATPATECARCHHLTQPDNAIRKSNTRGDTSEVLRLARELELVF